MYSAFLEKTSKRIAAVKQHLELSQQIRTTTEDGTLAQIANLDWASKLLSVAPDRLEWRLIDHCSAVTRIYAIYEQFAHEMIREHLSLVQKLLPYKNLSDELKATHRRGMSTILEKKDGPRYGHLNLLDLIREYNNALTEQPYALEPVAFLLQEQNLRLPELNRLFAGCGISDISTWIESSQPITQFFAQGGRLGGNAEHELRELINYRNDAAHGSIEISDLPGIDFLREFCDFTLAMCEAMAEKLLLESTNRLIDAGKASVCGKAKECLKDGEVIIIKVVGKLAVGDEVVFQGKNYCLLAKVTSLQIDNAPQESVELIGDTEVGIGLSSKCPKNARVIRLISA
jgi:hypothetical protein